MAVPANVETDPNANIITMLTNRLAREPDEVVIERQQPSGEWVGMTVREFDEDVVSVAKGLIALGIQVGDKLAIMSRTSYEWALLDYAIWSVGAVSVPIYETSSVDQVQWICSDAGVSGVFVETPAHAMVVEAARAQLPRLTQIWQLSQDAIGALREVGRTVADSTVAQRRRTARGSDLATIIYTSGTTGRPKGTELTHGHFVRLSENTINDETDRTIAPVIARPGCRTLLFLPLAHVFARFIQVIAISSHTVIGHCPDTKNLVPALGSFKPSFLLGVPRVLEKVYNAAEQKAGSGLKLKIFRWSAKVAIVYSRALDTKRGPSWWLKRQHKLADKLVYHSIREAMGGATKYAVSGGAALGERLGHFYRGVGLIVVEGYGLTETTAPILVNRPNRQKIGSVGIPFPGCEVRIAEDGEIMLRGVNVFDRYHNNPDATAQALRDGWFYTGDVGYLDDEGYLFITGRKKELIVTASGKNVAPAILEDRLRGHPLVSQVVVVGDGKPFIGALVTLDAEMLPGWLSNHGKPPISADQARTDEAVLASLERAVARTNQAVSRAESIRKFAVLEGDFTELNGYLTPSLKVKRDKVLADFADQIAKLYGEASTAAGANGNHH
ncbi:MAG: long-chain fatty acid--CoA ligase [Bifidobacteriaceae bacterium]|jgi:long-chain acyl-CoA synthetase|nr:long-chain fatty acid--CoA ligase [Bifidobacteriaceae bacterium]